ncbi:hypothetical protein AGLY_001866 [Aphis glycines]|uniref:Uncharacterized protein n=1 Tax=Aphis glycines TaxID=307491 RepID=A0A6G0U446_APHGL|nr:hypothetical protein AGLY_001866 [Aphis glycines]
MFNKLLFIIVDNNKYSDILLKEIEKYCNNNQLYYFVNFWGRNTIPLRPLATPSLRHCGKEASCFSVLFNISNSPQVVYLKYLLAILKFLFLLELRVNKTNNNNKSITLSKCITPSEILQITHKNKNLDTKVNVIRPFTPELCQVKMCSLSMLLVWKFNFLPYRSGGNEKYVGPFLHHSPRSKIQLFKTISFLINRDGYLSSNECILIKISYKE